MLGRFIVALLVAASAAFVVLQQRETESRGIEVDVAAQRASDASKRAAEQERAIAELTGLVDALRAKAAWQEQELAALAQDCTPNAEQGASVAIGALRRRPTHGDLVGKLEPQPDGRPDGRFALVLHGDAAEVTRVRLYPGLDDGTPMRTLPGCDTLEGRGGALLGVVIDGRQRVAGFGAQAIPKTRGTVTWELRCDLDLERGTPLVAEIVVAGSGAVRHVIGPAPIDERLVPPIAPLEGPLDPTTITRVVRDGFNAVIACVTADTRSLPPGRQRLEITVEPRGVVTHARLLNPAVDTSPVGRCVAAAAKRWRFPAFAGETIKLEVPLLLYAD